MWRHAEIFFNFCQKEVMETTAGVFVLYVREIINILLFQYKVLLTITFDVLILYVCAKYLLLSERFIIKLTKLKTRARGWLSLLISRPIIPHFRLFLKQ